MKLEIKNPKRSMVVMVKRRGKTRENIAVYDKDENVFFHNGKIINDVISWKQKML